jgi:hypothetical protein
VIKKFIPGIDLDNAYHFLAISNEKRSWSKEAGDARSVYHARRRNSIKDMIVSTQ